MRDIGGGGGVAGEFGPERDADGGKGSWQLIFVSAVHQNERRFLSQRWCLHVFATRTSGPLNVFGGQVIGVNGTGLALCSCGEVGDCLVRVLAVNGPFPFQRDKKRSRGV